MKRRRRGPSKRIVAKVLAELRRDANVARAARAARVKYNVARRIRFSQPGIDAWAAGERNILDRQERAAAEQQRALAQHHAKLTKLRLELTQRLSLLRFEEIKTFESHIGACLRHATQNPSPAERLANRHRRQTA